MSKEEFSITFWIRVQNNHSWNEIGSDIRFPPFTIPNTGVKVHCCKYGKIFKIYILHPDVGYRKLTADITNYIGKDTFVAVVNTEDDVKLYLNAELVETVRITDLYQQLEVGDFVMVNVEDGDLENIVIKGDLKVALPAEIKKIDGEDLTLFFYELNQITQLSKEKILY